MRQAGAIPSQIIEQFIAGGNIRAVDPIPADNIQPASLDLRLGRRGWRVQAAFLPLRDEPIARALERYGVEEVDLSSPEVLELDQTYVIEVAEELNLPPGVHAYTNNKSSTGRMNVWARTLVDGLPRFDKIPAGYRGRAYVMVTPRSWPLRVQAGNTLNQARFLRGENRLADLELEMAHQQIGLVFDGQGNRDEPVLDSGLLLTVDLHGGVVGFEAIPCDEPVDLTSPKSQDGALYFREVRAREGEVLLRKNGFYILCTREFLRVPPLFAVEMVAYDIHSGEYRSHYAGFFDPGFGYGRQGEVQGTPAVLELDTHEGRGLPARPADLQDGLRTPDQDAGANLRSRPGLTLPAPAWTATGPTLHAARMSGAGPWTGAAVSRTGPSALKAGACAFGSDAWPPDGDSQAGPRSLQDDSRPDRRAPRPLAGPGEVRVAAVTGRRPPSRPTSDERCGPGCWRPGPWPLRDAPVPSASSGCRSPW